MENQTEFLQQLRDVFRVEAEEHLATLQESILDLEKAGPKNDPATIQRVFRAAHSLKGAARAVDYPDVESICHSIENLFSQVQKSALVLVSPTYDSLNGALNLLARILRGEASTPQLFNEVLANLEESSKKLHQAHEKAAPEPFRDSAVPIPATSEPIPPPSSTQTLKIRTDRLEKILSDAEELIPVRLAFAQNLAELKKVQQCLDGINAKEVAKLARKSEEDIRRFGALADSLLYNSRHAMMLPCSYITAGLPKMARDLSRELRKEVDFIIEDEGLEFEKSILDNLKSTFIHLVRNSVAHGIEMPEERIAAGKPARGTILLSIMPLAGGMAEFALKDDGAGIDIKRVKEAAVASGSLSREEAEMVDEASIISMIFLPAVSTSRTVTGISGRGIGLAIVHEAVESIGGRVLVESRQGLGTTFRIMVPLTRITFNGVVVEASGRRFIFPATAVVKVARLPQYAVMKTRGAESIALDDTVYSLIHLADALGLPRTIHHDMTKHFSFIVLESTGRRLALVVDRIMEEQEVLMKPLGKLIPRVKGILGVSVLGSGEILPVLCSKDIVHEKLSTHTAAQTMPESDEARKSILVVEDSITSRMLLKSILESAGYEVTVANDGIEGLTALKTGIYNLVISDVEMPRMDGFQLTAAIRAEAGMERLPVILVTNLESREHREKGVAAGASAYIFKSDFAQSNLLATVARFL